MHDDPQEVVQDKVGADHEQPRARGESEGAAAPPFTRTTGGPGGGGEREAINLPVERGARRAHEPRGHLDVRQEGANEREAGEDRVVGEEPGPVQHGRRVLAAVGRTDIALSIPQAQADVARRSAQGEECPRNCILHKSANGPKRTPCASIFIWLCQRWQTYCTKKQTIL